MNALTRIAAERIAEQPLTVHLYSDQSGTVEVEGAGYKPATVQGVLTDKGVVYSNAVFTFDGFLGMVFRWRAKLNGEPIDSENEVFDKPEFVERKGHRIIIPLSAGFVE